MKIEYKLKNGHKILKEESYINIINRLRSLSTLEEFYHFKNIIFELIFNECIEIDVNIIYKLEKCNQKAEKEEKEIYQKLYSIIDECYSMIHCIENY